MSRTGLPLEDRVRRCTILLDMGWNVRSAYDTARTAKAILKDEKTWFHRSSDYWRVYISHHKEVWEAIRPWVDFSPDLLSKIDTHFEDRLKE
jgi:hypothetical protein